MNNLITKRTFLASVSAATAIAGVGFGVGQVYAQSIPASTGNVDEAKLLAAATLKDMVEGEENAPVTIVEYASFTCNHCASFTTNTMPEIREKYIKTGKARLVFREFAYDQRAMAASMLVRCVAEDRYFPFTQLLFEKQPSWAFVSDARPPLIQLSKLAGLSEEQFNACFQQQSVLDGLNATRTTASEEFDVRATPTFFINGKQYAGALSVEQMSAIIDRELGQ